jgi:hypothetical protein
MWLTNLAPEIQEAILFLPRAESGPDTMKEIEVRRIARVMDWGVQRGMWREQISGFVSTTSIHASVGGVGEGRQLAASVNLVGWSTRRRLGTISWALCRVAATPLSSKINLVNLSRKILENAECGNAQNVGRKMKIRLTYVGNAPRQAVTDGISRVSTRKSPTAIMKHRSTMKT